MKKQQLTIITIDNMSDIIGGSSTPGPSQDATTKCLLMVFGAGCTGYLTGLGAGGGMYSVLGSFGGMATAAAAGCS